MDNTPGNEVPSTATEMTLASVDGSCWSMDLTAGVNYLIGYGVSGDNNIADDYRITGCEGCPEI